MELKHGKALPLSWLLPLLLIVPYGIETRDGQYALGDLAAFNRTLWN